MQSTRWTGHRRSRVPGCRRRPDAPGGRILRGVARALLLAPFAVPAATGQSVAGLVEQARVLGIRTAVAAADVDDRRTVAAFAADRAFVPASNQKLLTVAACLDALGPDYRFRTGFAVRDGVLRVAAGGDPNWITGGEHDPARIWTDVAARLVESGVPAIRGLELDAGPFGGALRPTGWPGDQLHLHYAAPTGGLVVDRALWRVDVSGGDHDAIVRLVAPPDGFTLAGRIVMTDDRDRGGVYGMRVRDGQLELWGHFLRGAGPRSERGAIDDPERVFRRVAERQLAAHGVAFDPRAPATDADLPDVETPVLPCVERTLRHSSNFDAEQLLRVLGAELRDDGSFAGGAEAVEGQLARLCGSLPEEVVIADGSGLSRDNRVTADFLVRLLVAAVRTPWSEAFVAALPRAGEEGTLRRRFRDSPVAGAVRAKTGTLSGVSALSGYLKRADGSLVAFAILMEWDRLGKHADPRGLQERIVEALYG